MFGPFYQPLGTGHEAGYYRPAGYRRPPAHVRAAIFLTLAVLVGIGASGKLILRWYHPCSHLIVLGVTAPQHAGAQRLMFALSDGSSYTAILPHGAARPQEGDDVWLCGQRRSPPAKSVTLDDPQRHVVKVPVTEL